MPTMPWDFVVYILLAVIALVLSGAVVVGLLVLAVRKVRRHNAEVRAKQLLAKAREGYVVIDEEDALAGDDVTAILDAVFGPRDDRDRWAS